MKIISGYLAVPITGINKHQVPNNIWITVIFQSKALKINLRPKELISHSLTTESNSNSVLVIQGVLQSEPNASRLIFHYLPHEAPITPDLPSCLTCQILSPGLFFALTLLKSPALWIFSLISTHLPVSNATSSVKPFLVPFRKQSHSL